MIFKNRTTDTGTQELSIVFSDETRILALPASADATAVQKSLSLMFCGDDTQAKEMLGLCNNIPAGILGLLLQAIFDENITDEHEAICLLAVHLVQLGQTLGKLKAWQYEMCLALTAVTMSELKKWAPKVPSNFTPEEPLEG